MKFHRVFKAFYLTCFAATPVFAQNSTPEPSHNPIMHKSPGIEQRVLLENADVRVSRIAIPPGATWVPDSPRLKRVIIWITGSHTERHALELHSNQKLSADRGEIAEREAGNAVFRTPSKHSITNHGTETQISVIVELKK